MAKGILEASKETRFVWLILELIYLPTQKVFKCWLFPETLKKQWELHAFSPQGEELGHHYNRYHSWYCLCIPMRPWQARPTRPLSATPDRQGWASCLTALPLVLVTFLSAPGMSRLLAFWGNNLWLYKLHTCDLVLSLVLPRRIHVAHGSF